MKKTIFAIGVALSLTACASVSPMKSQQLASQVPTNYREQIVSYVKNTLKDPYSIKSAEISPPTTSFVGLVNGGDVPGICVRFNAKNSFGAYIGVETQSFAFKNGVVIGMGPPVFNTCQGVPYEPFPELEQIG